MILSSSSSNECVLSLGESAFCCNSGTGFQSDLRRRALRTRGPPKVSASKGFELLRVLSKRGRRRGMQPHYSKPQGSACEELDTEEIKIIVVLFGPHDADKHDRRNLNSAEDGSAYFWSSTICLTAQMLSTIRVGNLNVFRTRFLVRSDSSANFNSKFKAPTGKPARNLSTRVSDAEAFIEPSKLNNGIKYLSLNRPQSKNAISMKLLKVSSTLG